MRLWLLRHWDPGIVLIAAGLAAAFILVVLSLMVPPAAGSGELPADAASRRPSDVRQGSLFLAEGGSGRYSAVLSLKTEVNIEVSGMVAFVRVVQEFANDSDQWLEGVYVFPLPDNAAVSRMIMDVGDRVIEGVVREREEARRTYSEAKNEGRTVSLLEQERPNIFTMSVANIGPGEKIMVELEYQQLVRFAAGVFSLRFPTVIGPRYMPADQAGASGSLGGTGLPTGDPPTGDLPAALRHFPPAVEPGEKPGSRVSLAVMLHPGFSLSRVQSLYHAADIETDKDGKTLVTLIDTGAAVDRDFVLEWAPLADGEVQTALFAEEKDGTHYLYLLVTPPMADSGGDHYIPREVIFVVDVSGSMGGPSLRQAKEALAYGISRLRPADRFNIIAFSDSVAELFSYPQTATREHIRQARRYVDDLAAGGGTEIGPALVAALDGAQNPARLRQVIFLTDGCVGNEQQLFATVRERLGDSRLFTVGIGSAPNSYFMRNIAARGKGTFTYIGDVREVRRRVQELFSKLEHPLLTEIMLAGITAAEMFPAPIPDLYLGEPLGLVAATAELPGKLTLSGYFAGRYWETEVDASSRRESRGIAILWARQKIKTLMDALDGGADPAEVRSRVIATALGHQLASRYTSFVTVDVTPARPGYENLAAKTVAAAMPGDWGTNKVINLPRTGTVSELCLVLGALALLLAVIIKIILRRERARVCRNRKF